MPSMGLSVDLTELKKTIRELEDRSVKITPTEIQRVTQQKKMGQSIQELWDNIKWPYTNQNPRERRKRMGLKAYIFEEITQNVPTLVTYTKPEILEVQKSRIIHKTAPGHRHNIFQTSENQR